MTRSAGGRHSWEVGRQAAEQALRRSLRMRGIEPPRQCPTCTADLEVFRDAGGALTVRCSGECGRRDGRSALAHLRKAGAAPLPGFEGL